MRSSVQPTSVECINECKDNPGPPSDSLSWLEILFPEAKEGRCRSVSPRVWVPGQGLLHSCLVPPVSLPFHPEHLTHLYTHCPLDQEQWALMLGTLGRKDTLPYTYILEKEEKMGQNMTLGSCSLGKKISSGRHKVEGSWQFCFK